MRPWRNAFGKMRMLCQLQVCSRASLDYSRAFSSSRSSSSSSDTLKSQLRELYKRIHPDLFHHHTEAKTANERSFKLLQEYLEAARKGGESGGALLPYNFEFYMQSQVAVSTQEEDGGNAHDSGDSDDVKLDRVTLSLPPPARRHPGDGGELSRTTLKALRRLLSACGVKVDVKERSATDEPEPAPISQFVPQAVEVMLKRSMQQSGPRQQISTTKLAMQFGKQVSAGFSAEVAERGAAEQLRLLQRLVGALDLVPDAPVCGIRFMLGDKYGVDAQGRLWLDVNDTQAAWARHLAFEADLPRCQDLSSLQQQLRSLERSVASAVGVSMLYCMPSLEGSTTYREFLERLAAAAGTRGKATSPADISGVGVCVVDSASMEASSSNGNDLRVDGGKGQVLAHIHTTPDQLYEFLKLQGARVASVVERNSEAERSMGLLRRQVERKLRLRRLIRDEALEISRFRAACLRLLHHAPELMPVLDSLPIRISVATGVAADGSYINIPWDFQI